MSEQQQGSQVWHAANYDERIGYVSEYGKSVVELLRVRPGERVLDIGCGTGDLCQELTGRGATTHGIDSSEEMVARAREKYPRLSFDAADAYTYRTVEPFDAVFSNAALHWMTRPAEVLATVKQALAPGGRFVCEFGGSRNIGTIVSAISEALRGFGRDASERHPWYFPTIGQYAALAEEAGLRVEAALHFARPTPLAGGERGLAHWLDMFAGVFFDGMTEADKREAYAEMERLTAPTLYRDGQWTADYWRLRVLAVRE